MKSRLRGCANKYSRNNTRGAVTVKVNTLYSVLKYDEIYKEGEFLIQSSNMLAPKQTAATLRKCILWIEMHERGRVRGGGVAAGATGVGAGEGAGSAGHRNLN